MAMSCRRTPARRTDSWQVALAGVDLGVEAAPELRIAGVGDDLLAGLGVLDDDQAELGQLQLERIDQPHRDDLVAVGEP